MSGSQMDDRGLSPVLGTVLAIAIAVALAAGVWVMVNILREDARTEDPVLIGFAEESDAARLRVVTVNQDLDWFDNIQFSGSCSPTLNGAPYPTASGSRISPGDVLGCSPGQDLKVIALLDDDASLVYQVRFR